MAASLPALCGLLEGALLVAPQGASVPALARMADVSPDDVTSALRLLTEHYDADGHGMTLLWLSGDGETAVRLVSSSQHAAVLGRFLGTAENARLSAAALETLAVVAYRQPVTRADIEAIRGVNCEGVLTTLAARDLVVESGRADMPGRPRLYVTTSQFLVRFGLTALTDLPPVAHLPLSLPTAAALPLLL